MLGDTDISPLAALLADPARGRILLALGDGRALAASVLADEAGVAASTASAHLSKLVAGGLLAVEKHGRHRYFRLAGPEVGELLEALSRLSGSTPIRSLRDGTKAKAVRYARTCYDHLAGLLGTGLMAAMIDDGTLAGGDGVFDPSTAERDRLSSPGFDYDYRLTANGLRRLTDFGIDFESLPRRRPLIRYCVDWSEQRHHLAGSLGAAIAERMFELGWIRRANRSRAVHLTDEGTAGLHEQFGLQLARY
jgi:DNA-binding transcriptional ArsR family regulator